MSEDISIGQFVNGNATIGKQILQLGHTLPVAEMTLEALVGDRQATRNARSWLVRLTSAAMLVPLGISFWMLSRIPEYLSKHSPKDDAQLAIELGMMFLISIVCGWMFYRAHLREWHLGWVRAIRVLDNRLAAVNAEIVLRIATADASFWRRAAMLWTHVIRG